MDPSLLAGMLHLGDDLRIIVTPGEMCTLLINPRCGLGRAHNDDFESSKPRFWPLTVAIISLQFEVTSLARFIDIDAIQTNVLRESKTT